MKFLIVMFAVFFSLNGYTRSLGEPMTCLQAFKQFKMELLENGGFEDSVSKATAVHPILGIAAINSSSKSQLFHLSKAYKVIQQAHQSRGSDLGEFVRRVKREGVETSSETIRQFLVILDEQGTLCSLEGKGFGTFDDSNHYNTLLTTTVNIFKAQQELAYVQ